MRGGKSFLILLVVAAGLGAYLYFVESKRDTTDPVTKHDKVFAVDATKIEQITITSAIGEVTTLKKNGMDWQIFAAEPVDADVNAASSVASTIGSLETQRVVDDNPASVAPYGLEPPRYSVAFRLAGESSDHRLNVGSKTPNGADVYARVDGQPKLLLLSASTDDSLNRTTFELRDKSVLKLPADGVDSLKIEAAGSPAVSLEKKGADWHVTTPAASKADFTSVDAVTNQVSQGKMKTFVASAGAAGLGAADMKKYGFDKPQVVVTVGTGSTRATLQIGAGVEEPKPADAKAKPADPKAADAKAKPAKPEPKPEPTSYYARDLSRPIVFTVDKAVVDGLKKKSDDFRSKDLFAFRSFSAFGADLTLGSQSFTFTKDKGPVATAANQSPAPAPDVWKQTKPTAKDLNQTAIVDVLTNLSNLRADKFTDKPLASGEDLVVVARFGDTASPTEERVTFRKSGTVVHAIRTGEPGAAIVVTADYDKALSAFTDLVGIKKK